MTIMAIWLWGLLLATANWQGIRDSAEGPRWWIAGGGAVVGLWVYRQVKMTAGHWLGLGLLGWMTVSLAWTPVLPDGLYREAHWLVLGACFAVGSGLSRSGMSGLWYGLAAGMTVNAGMAVAQLSGWNGVTQIATATPAGLFVNRMFMGELSAISLVGVLLLTKGRLRWLFAFGPFVALVVAQSRGAWVATGVAVWVIIWRQWPRPGLALMPLCLLGLIGLGMLRPETLRERFAIWLDLGSSISWNGSGVGSLYSTYPQVTTRLDTGIERPEHAHNDLLEITYELGLTGTLLAVGFAAAVLRQTDLTERLVLGVVLAMGLVGFPCQMPGTGSVAALLAGSVCRNSGCVYWDELVRRMALWTCGAARWNGGRAAARTRSARMAAGS